MRRDFSEELLSAYLDGELSPAERAAVDHHLAGSPADRELLADLKSLRRELTALPRANVDAEFTDRVVQAALAATAPPNAAVSLPPPTTRLRRRKIRSWVVVATTAAAIAASVLLVWQPWRGASISGPKIVVGPSPVQPDPPLSPAERIATTLFSSILTNEDEAVVVRLRVPKGVSLDPLLTEAGIPQRRDDSKTIDNDLADKYQRQHPGAGVAASDALLVQAPLGLLERAFTSLASDSSAAVDLVHEGRLAFNLVSAGEGAAAAQTFAQRLDAGLFQLNKRDVSKSQSRKPVALGDDLRQKRLRLLILVERVDAE